MDIVKLLCEHSASSVSDGTRAVDVRSKDGWTPLSKARLNSSDPEILELPSTVNASSKGHLPVVLYLLTKQSANPLVRNKWGETAYDVAAAVFEVWICEVGVSLVNSSTDLDSVIGSSANRSRAMAWHHFPIQPSLCTYNAATGSVRESKA